MKEMTQEQYRKHGWQVFAQGYPCPTGNYRMAQGWCEAKADYMRQIADQDEIIKAEEVRT